MAAVKSMLMEAENLIANRPLLDRQQLIELFMVETRQPHDVAEYFIDYSLKERDHEVYND